jgi:hypothetical protein
MMVDKLPLRHPEDHERYAEFLKEHFNSVLERARADRVKKNQ